MVIDGHDLSLARAAVMFVGEVVLAVSDIEVVLVKGEVALRQQMIYDTSSLGGMSSTHHGDHVDKIR